jgi:hypothetical protein
MSTLPLVDLSPWRFAYQASLAQTLRGQTIPDTVFDFPSVSELLKFLTTDKEDNHGRFQSLISDKLTALAEAKAWKRLRKPLSKTRHFARYRKSHYERYHTAGRNVSAGTATEKEQILANALQAEVAGSTIITPVGQVLFHGRANRFGVNPYPAFLSTSFDPIVARNSAFRRAAQGGRPVVYVLTVTAAIPGLWGQVGRSCEYEIMVGRLRTITVTQVISLSRSAQFDVVEANLA